MTVLFGTLEQENKILVKWNWVVKQASKILGIDIDLDVTCKDKVRSKAEAVKSNNVKCFFYHVTCSHLQTFEKIISASQEDLYLCPGFGPQKVCIQIKVNLSPRSICTWNPLGQGT